MATSRNPSSSEVNSTPVRIGRDSSLLAARSTWPTACRNIEAGRVTAASAGWPRRGKSSIENGRTVNDERSPVISTVSPPASTTTAPGASVRTASAVSRPGTTQEPSRSPLTSMVRWIVSSRSVPLISRREPSRVRPHAGEDRLRTGAALRGPSRGGQSLPEHITLAAELHCRPSPIGPCPEAGSFVIIKMLIEPSGSNRSWGLCASRYQACSHGGALVPRRRQPSTTPAEPAERAVDDRAPLPSSYPGCPQPGPQRGTYAPFFSWVMRKVTWS